jgi:hypothetical protein
MYSNAIGNPYKGVTQDQLLRDTVTLVLPAGGSIASTSYTVPQGRGNVQGIEFSTSSNTLADLVLANFNLQANKKSIISAENLVPNSPAYANRWKPFMCNIPEQGVVDISGNNTSANSITVIFTFLYYPLYVVQSANIEQVQQ